jgi:hypothetical protein
MASYSALLVVEIRGNEYGQSGHGLQCAGAPLAGTRAVRYRSCWCLDRRTLWDGADDVLGIDARSPDFARLLAPLEV